ncbi:unnamed protein product [Dovyalis caffra]|uniref:Uncharacterized protein n=1 Tax=Dovyalis caffra TaxID=77055 RepID=A0AAV1R7T5_9ROSI|nr:unnamed protein product [Dovyalis caffra]
MFLLRQHAMIYYSAWQEMRVTMSPVNISAIPLQRNASAPSISVEKKLYTTCTASVFDATDCVSDAMPQFDIVPEDIRTLNMVSAILEKPYRNPSPSSTLSRLTFHRVDLGIELLDDHRLKLRARRRL